MSSPKRQATSVSGVTPRDPSTYENSNPNASHEGGNSPHKVDPPSNGAAAIPVPDVSNVHVFPAPSTSSSNSNSNSNSEQNTKAEIPPSSIQISNSNCSSANASVPGWASGPVNFQSPPLSTDEILQQKVQEKFPFKNPFAAAANMESQHIVASAANASLFQPPVSLVDSKAGGTTASAAITIDQPISTMPAKTLSEFIGGRIQGVKFDAWIQEDISGLALIECVAPSCLAEFLEQTANITSGFARKRIENILQTLIAQDPFIPANVKSQWREHQLRSSAINAASAASSQAPGASLLHSSPTVVPAQLFQTPPSHSNLSVASGASAAPTCAPSFFSEIKSRNSLSLEDSSLFSSEQTHSASRASVSSNASFQAVHGGSGAVPFREPFNIQVTLNTPSAKPVAYPILETACSAEFYTWLRSCRKVTLMAMPVDRKPLNMCVSQDVKDEIARVIVDAHRNDPALFDSGAPYPENWPSITDKLLLKVLFGINGPRGAAEAKARLKKIVFYFNDSTTEQSAFTQKLRKHCNKVKSDLADFGYNSRKWKEGDKLLSHEMILEAFAEGFSNTEQIKGPEDKLVPRCRNLAIIRELIRERKKIDLEDLCTYLINFFDNIDETVRANRGVKYETRPWVAQTKAKKRGFNAISTDGGAGAGKPPKTVRDRPPAEHPRCNNCGSKGHACSERTCYLWGAPGALGASGNWPDGTKSLRLTDEEWKAFRTVRHHVFYAYPENKARAKPNKN